MSEAPEQGAAAEYGGLDEITREMATPEFHQDPYPLYARMRREYPVYRSSQRIWYLTRYADVDAALHDPHVPMPVSASSRRLRSSRSICGT